MDIKRLGNRHSCCGYFGLRIDNVDQVSDSLKAAICQR